MKAQVLLLFSGLVSAAQVQGYTSGVVSLPFERKSVAARGLRRRAASTFETTTGDQFYAYQVNATVGTPPQNIGLSLDTGSSDIVLLTSESEFCKVNDVCPIITSYNANKSSSYSYLNSQFNNSYGFAAEGEASGASGDWATDDFNFAGASIKNQQLAIAYDATIAFSILGLSYATGEGTTAYNNLPLSMAASGATNLALFTLWQDVEEASGHTGGILFGGIDEAKYSGDLVTLPIQTRPNEQNIIAFDIIMTGLALTSNESKTVENNTGSQLTVIDCGTSTSIIQDDWANPILDHFNVNYISSNDTAIIDCDVINSNYTLEYSFNGITIKAPIANFVGEFAENRCFFGIVPAGNRMALIGVNFLASAVTAFDISNNQISLAQRNFAATGENVVAVPKGGVAELSNGTSSSTSASPSATATASGSGTTSQTGTATGSAATPSTTKKSDATGGVAALGYAVVAFVAISCLFVSM